MGRWLRRGGTLLLAVTVGVSPLLAGSVHRPAAVGILAGTFLTLLAVLVGERLRGGSLRGRQFSPFLLVLLLIPLAQIVPLPTSVRGKIDPGGVALLENAPGGTPTAWPLSLDPSSTRTEIGTAAAALIVFALALHAAAGRRRRLTVLNAIGVAGVVAVCSGIGHRIFGIDRLYGLFPAAGVLPGPFINPNHCAEFYELAAFTALALAQNSSAEVRIGWYVAAGLSAAAATTTLSRGAVLALFAGGSIFVMLRVQMAARDNGEGARPGAARTRTVMIGSLLALGGLVSAAVALGASPVLDELAHTNLTNGSEKLVLWKDSLPMIFRHPLGIGRHAFDRVYPAYKTLGMNSRFQFVENWPLQLVIDVGLVGCLILVAVFVLQMRKVTRRRDSVEAALIAGLVAVVAHNLVDFGFEIPGIRLPFAAVAGALVGRAHARASRDERSAAPSRRRPMWIPYLVASAGLAVGLWTLFQPNADQIEKQWRDASTPRERRMIAIQGGERYPTDFFFPLLQSYDEPLRTEVPMRSSPQLAALNRALRLCPSCSFIHEQTARALLRLGLRSQALSSFRDTVRLAPGQLSGILNELNANGYSASELATMAVGDGPSVMQVVRFLIPKKADAKVRELLSLARERGVPDVERALAEIDLEVIGGRFEKAKALLADMRRQFPHDGRTYAVLARVAELEGHPELALEQMRIATTMTPADADYARRYLDLVRQAERWTELEEALERFKFALRQSAGNLSEAHMAAGNVHHGRGNLARALSEFRTAATLDAANPATWLAVARVSEDRGDLSGAVEAYQRIAVMRPDDASVQQAIARIEKQRADARLRQLLP